MGPPNPAMDPPDRGWVALASGSQIAALVLGGATNILYARLLRPTQLGQLALVLTLAGVAMVLTELGLHTWLTRAIAAGDVSLGDASALIVKLAPLLTAAVGVVGVAIFQARPMWRDALGVTSAQVLLVPELAVALALYQAALTLTQGTGAFRARSAALFTNAALTTGLTALALAISPSAVAAIHATAAAYLGAAVWFIARTMRGGRVAPVDPRLARQAVKEARPIWFNTLLSFAASSGDALLARSVLPLSEVGYYLVIKKVTMAAVAPLTVLLPMLYARLSAARSDRERVTTYSSYQRWLAFAFAAGTVFAAPWIVPVLTSLFGERYADRHVALLILAGALCLQAVHDLLGYLLAATKAYAAPLVANGAVAVTSVALVLSFSSLSLSQFALVLATAHAIGVVVMVGTARRRQLLVPLVLLPATLLLAGVALVATWGLVGLPLPASVPLSVVLVVALVATVTVLDREGRARLLRLFERDA